MDGRIHQLQKLLQEQNFDGVLLTSSPNISYLSNYHGFVPEERDAYILITESAAYLFTNVLYIEEIRRLHVPLNIIEINRSNFFQTILPNLLNEHKIKLLGIEEDNLTAAEYKNLKHLSLTMKATDLSSLRVVKNATEIAAIKKACAIGDQAYFRILKAIKIGITEKELAQLLELYMKQEGADPSFRSVIAFGPNAAVPHHLSDETKLKKNICVLMDFGAKVDGYCSDMTRTFFFGKATDKQRDVYQTALIAQQKATEFIEQKLHEGEKIFASTVDQTARDYITSKKLPSFNHSSHGIGLEGHEAPRFSPRLHDTLEEGMVFTIEPGIYLSGNMGVRIEDVFTIKQNKLVQLTKAPSELLEVKII